MPPPPPPPPRPEWPIPTLNVRVDDLAHPGAKLFFESVNPADALRDAVTAVFQWLYVTTASAPAQCVRHPITPRASLTRPPPPAAACAPSTSSSAPSPASHTPPARTPRSRSTSPSPTSSPPPPPPRRARGTRSAACSRTRPSTASSTTRAGPVPRASSRASPVRARPSALRPSSLRPCLQSPHPRPPTDRSIDRLGPPPREPRASSLAPAPHGQVGRRLRRDRVLPRLARGAPRPAHRPRPQRRPRLRLRRRRRLQRWQRTGTRVRRRGVPPSDGVNRR